MIIDTAKLLGTLFYQKCSKQEQIEIVSALVDEHVLTQATLDALFEQDEEQLNHDFSELFEGVGDMPVPPWGSVYLDKERVLFGESTIAYRRFLEQNEVALDTGLREPEDHFGLMLLAFAFLLEKNNQEAGVMLMEKHFLPWGFVYLELLNNKSNNLYYKNLTNNVNEWLQKLVNDINLTIDKRKLYINNAKPNQKN
ncbi:molecular chaperone TorD family protein [Vibrio hannami]|uniref:molecular chaperone TorD family protein n=1 Tax=Vibrio hannami TaxID=2717094 RepID=UPI00240F2A84|nr:molecular chaperone TorD family protein [Vibrio hannami]MDG3088442.1 molecular chaperone TorD family protein [Vibrio hannami]